LKDNEIYYYKNLRNFNLKLKQKVTPHSPGAFQDPAGMLKKFYQREPLTI